MGISSPLVRAATSFPALGRAVVSLAARSGVNHWIFPEISRRLDHRVSVPATLPNGMRMEVFWNDAVGDMIRGSSYEPETIAILERYLGPGKVFFDIGANVGLYTLLAAGMGADVHAFEPDPRTFAMAERNVRSNDLAGVKVNAFALSDSPGEMEFFPGSTGNVGGGALSRHRPAHGTPCVVKCETLDRYMSECQPGQVSLVKIDVEGAETMVLAGGRSLLAQRPVIVIEFSDKLQSAFGSSNARLAGLLCAAGYDLYRLRAGGTAPYEPKTPDESYFNVLCVPEGSTV